MKAFTLFTQLDTELQGEIAGFLDWWDWGMLRQASKAMYAVCDNFKVKKEVFGPNMYFDTMRLPKEYAWMEETTKGTPLSTYSLEYGYAHYPFLVMGCAYNPFGKDLGAGRWLKWYHQDADREDVSSLPKQYFAMCVNACPDGRMGFFEAFQLGKDVIVIGSQPNSEHHWPDYNPSRDGCWEKWIFQYVHLLDEDNVDFQHFSNFIPCDMWVMPLDKYDSEDDIDLVDDIVHFFPSFEDVAVIHTKEDLVALYERVKELPSF